MRSEASFDQVLEIEEENDQEIAAIVLEAGEKTAENVKYLSVPNSFCCCWWWKRPLEIAQEHLEQKGYSEEQINFLLRPAYRKIVEALIERRKKFLEKYKLRPEETNWQCGNIIEIYQLLGDSHNSIKWEDALIISETVMKITLVMKNIASEIKEMEERGESERLISLKKYFYKRIERKINEMIKTRRLLGIN